MTISKGSSVQELLGIECFSKYGVQTVSGELVFLSVTPVNIAVLTPANIEQKIVALKHILSAYSDIGITCIDSCECFDNNKSFLKKRQEREENSCVREIIRCDIEMLDDIQAETASSREFMFIIRFKKSKPEQVFRDMNDIEKKISDNGFEVRRMKKSDIKRLIGIYFKTARYADAYDDYDGERYEEGESDNAV